MYTVREYWYWCVASAVCNKINNKPIARLMSHIAKDMILSGEYYG